MAQTRIFVSHSPIDESVTGRLVDDLRRAGADPWAYQADVINADLIDADVKRHIDEILDETLDEIRTHSDWLVLVQSPNAIASPQVRAEVDEALLRVNQGSMRGVIPFLVVPCAPGTIPPQWDALRRYDATHNYASALAGLLLQLGLAPDAQFPSVSREHDDDHSSIASQSSPSSM